MLRIQFCRDSKNLEILVAIDLFDDRKAIKMLKTYFFPGHGKAKSMEKWCLKGAPTKPKTRRKDRKLGKNNKKLIESFFGQ